MRQLTLHTILLCACTIVVNGCTSQATPAHEAATVQTSGTDQVANDSAAASQTAKAKSKLVCRKESIVGTRLNKTVCRTRQQIDDERAAAVDEMEDRRVYSDQ
jgi:hypothetical protein|tara:strand:- start:3954 stop:4262 length:309 start_codon:yes stop_codon:yes gene_type:complete